jgi:SpoIIAA-like
MIEILPDMPDDTFGVLVSRGVTGEDYTMTVLPILRKMRESGRPLRVLVVLEHFWEAPTAVWEGLKADIEFGVFRGRVWERFAVVSDLSWVDAVVHLASWLIPGEMRTFPGDELDVAKEWVAGSAHVAPSS